MMKFRLIGIGAIIFTVFLMIARCDLNGGGSNTGNARIFGLLVDPAGNCVPHGIVCLYTSDAIPAMPGTGETPAAGRDTCDAAGRYYFADVDSGSYNILGQDSAGSLKALLYDVGVNHRDSLFDTIVLQGTTALTGRVTNPQRSVTVCFVPGSPYITFVNDTTGDFRLKGIPPGPYPVIFSNQSNSVNNCSYIYTLDRQPDTSVMVAVTLNCQ
jgi:hypothetical protein